MGVLNLPQIIKKLGAAGMWSTRIRWKWNEFGNILIIQEWNEINFRNLRANNKIMNDIL